jgi:hypothetical protein
MAINFSAFINKNFLYAIVGASPQREKYGNIVLRNLGDAGYNVVGVNPKQTTIEGYPTYPALADIPKKPDVAVFVVPPDIGLRLLDDVQRSHIKKVWFQPGAESEEIRLKAKTLGLDVVADGSCIMVVRRGIEHQKNAAA